MRISIVFGNNKIMKAIQFLTFNINDKLLGWDLKTLFGTRPKFADPSPRVSQVQICHPDKLGSGDHGCLVFAKF